MKRFFKIAVSSLCLTACVLLVALWVRSYWFSERVAIPGMPIRLHHWRGEIGLFASPRKIPYLWAVLVAGTLAGLPWVKWSRRFSLRSFLVIATLICAVLGIVLSS